jgi:hypothetical protein
MAKLMSMTSQYGTSKGTTSLTKSLGGFTTDSIAGKKNTPFK